MWNPNNFDHFKSIVNDLLYDPTVQTLRDQRQHSKHSNAFDHSVHVAYLSFLFCRRFNLDYVSAARGAMLHDLHMKNWDEENDGIRRLWRHPHYALQNATSRYDLSALEQDIIVKHMWPLTRPLPRHRESFVVSMADKVCAMLEMSRLTRLFKVQKHLACAAA